MAKLNANTNLIQKATRIQPALRTNAIYKWRNRMKPLRNTQSGRRTPALYFKLKYNSTVTILNVASSFTQFNAGVQSGLVDFNTTYFTFNSKRHQLGNSDQG